MKMSYDYIFLVNVEFKYFLNKLDLNKNMDLFYIGFNDEWEVIRMLGYDNLMIMFIVKVQI